MWEVKIGQGGSIRTQNRITSISVTHDPFLQSFSLTIKNPTWTERQQARGRVDNAIVQIKRGSEILMEGFIENVEGGADRVTYSGRSFLVLLGYSTSSETTSGGDTKAEYSNATGSSIITNLLSNFCYPKDNELTYTDITFTETYGGEIKLHGKKVYQIVKEMCSSHGKDIWSDATWNVDGINIDNKNIHIGEKSRGSSGSPHKTLRGGQHLRDIPVIKYKTGAEMMNCLRVIGKGEGKDQVSVWCEDTPSITSYGYIEGQPYRSNMIADKTTATTIGNAIIAAKKDPVTQIKVQPAYYIGDLKYGDWVQVIDEHSNIDTVKRIKKIVYIYTVDQIDSMELEVGDKFNNYENIINDLTKGDVDAEKEMTLGGGSFRITANEPPSTWIRIEKGSWYGTDGVFYKWDTDTSRVFWGGNPPYNATTVNNYFKALIQIKNNATSASDIEYKTSLTSGAHTGYDKTTAEGETIAPDDGYTPLGEIILKCKTTGGTVYDVEATDEGGSYIYQDVRPIIGSSATGFGGEGLWENTGTPEYSQLILAQDINLQNKVLYFDKDISNTKIYRSGDNLILSPTSTSSYVGVMGVLSTQYGINAQGSNITDVQNLTMDDSSSILNMNFGTIINSDDITLYDGGSMSPKLQLKVPFIETAGGVEFVATDNKLYCNKISGGVLAQCTLGTNEWYFLGSIKTLGDINIDGYDIINLDDVKANSSTGIDIKDSSNTTKITLATTTYAAECAASIDMDANDILKCKNIKGQTTGTDGADRLNLDFRGDGNHRIYYTGISDNRLGYNTHSKHSFAIQSNVIADISANGLEMNTGKYIKSVSGDLELRVPTGSKIKFVVG